MPLLIACPNCRLEGQLPDEEAGGVVACPACGSQFSPQAALPPASAPASVDSLSVWVGSSRAPTDTPMPAGAIRPPVQVTADNAAAHLEWLREEVRRFNAHVMDQLDLLGKQREELAQLESRIGAELVIRTQDVNRKEAELAGRELALTRLAAEQEAKLNKERAALGRRADEIARMEQSLQRRLEEVEEVEQELRGELEAREAEVERQRREVEQALRELRSSPPAVSPSPEQADPSGHCCG